MGEIVGLPLALTDELRPIARRLGLRGRPGGPWHGRYANHDVIALLAGVGRGRAGMVAARLIEQHGATWLIAAGFAGGLDAAVRVGSRWFLRAVLTTDDPCPRSGWTPPGAETAVGLSADGILVGLDEKRQAARTGAVLVDCETAAVAAVALSRGLTWSGVRMVSDDLVQPLPAVVLRHLDRSRGRVRLGPLFADLLVHPGGWPALARLARQHRTLGAGLAEGLAELLEARR